MTWLDVFVILLAAFVCGIWLGPWWAPAALGTAAVWVWACRP